MTNKTPHFPRIRMRHLKYKTKKKEGIIVMANTYNKTLNDLLNEGESIVGNEICGRDNRYCENTDDIMMQNGVRPIVINFNPVINVELPKIECNTTCSLPRVTTNNPSLPDVSNLVNSIISGLGSLFSR
jgi:hypothetical protein